MLQDRACSIYANRPRTCRDYDCRMLAAAGLDAGAGAPAINDRVRAWVFSYEGDAERCAHDAVRAAAAFVRDRRDCFPGGMAPTVPTEIAVLAVKVYPVFLNSPHDPVETAKAIVAASRAF
jgi:hypothetical protein